MHGLGLKCKVKLRFHYAKINITKLVTLKKKRDYYPGKSKIEILMKVNWKL